MTALQPASTRAFPRPTGGRGAPAWLRSLLAASLLGGAVSAPAGAALANPKKEDINFDGEHLLESDMDARFASLAFAGGRLRPGAWQPTVALAYYDTSAGLLKLSGVSLGLGLARGLTEHWSLQLLGFYERADVSGDDANDELLPLFSRNLPLDLPENADFSDAGGDVTQWSVGVAATRQRASSGPSEGLWTLSYGVLYDRLEAKDYTVAFRLTGGADAGVAGLLDLSATYAYTAPFFDVRYSRRLGSSWRIEPRATATLPLPGRGFAGRLQGPGFDIAGDTADGGHGVHMGDPAVGLGLSFEHVRSHLAIDIGGLVLQPLVEGVSHAGVDRAWLIHVRWHGGR